MKTDQLYRCPTCRHEDVIGVHGFAHLNAGGLICPKCNWNFFTLIPAKPKKPSTLTRSRLKPMSTKRKELLKEVGPERKARKASVGRCMVCRKEFPPEELDGDEIATGTAREECLSVPELTLISCRACHGITQGWPPAKRIALLVAFEIDFKCSKYCELKGYTETHLKRDSVLNYLDYSTDITAKGDSHGKKKTSSKKKDAAETKAGGDTSAVVGNKTDS